MPSLHSKLHDLATTFAEQVLAALRTASLDELTDGAPRRGPGRPRGGGTSTGNPSSAKVKNGRLARRSPEDIEQALGLVVAALQAGPMRAEEIKKSLGIDKRELPRVIAEGLKTKKIKKRGAKRSTTYSVG